MNYGPFEFSIVPHKDGAFPHHLEAGPFTSAFILTPILGPFLRNNEELGHPWEVIDILKKYFVDFTCDIF